MTGPRCLEKKHITATIEYSSPTAWGRLAEMIRTDSQPGSSSQWTPDGLLRGHALVAPAWNLPRAGIPTCGR
jgi:hypothetical protein